MNRCLPLTFVLFTIILAFHGSSAWADVHVASIFSDNMVLQRDQPIKVWGVADAGEKITVVIDGSGQAAATTDAQGHWLATLPGMPATKAPFEIQVSSADQTIKFKNVVAGDVWVCSGQSNMEWRVNGTLNSETERANANYPLIRQVKINNQTSLFPKQDAENSGWRVCTPENVGDFTAVGYFFGRELNQELDVPIGLLNTSWGGTIIETWISAESLETHLDFSETVKKMKALGENSAKLKSAQNDAAEWDKDFANAMNDQSTEWAETNLDDSQWDEQTVPGLWEQQGYPDLDGVAWYRREIEIPPAWAGKEMSLSLAMADDQDETFVNGKSVGGKNLYNDERKYTVAPESVSAGPMEIAVRVTDTGGGGGIHGTADAMFASVADQKPISLAGKWKFKVSEKTAALGKRPQSELNGPNHPTLLYNAMIAPLHPFAFKGAIWYQGESNAGRAYQYRSLMPMLISDWRNKWSTPETKNEFPFYWVQLANFMKPATEPEESSWAELREAQSMALAVPHTGQAVIIDIGEANDIHPKNKQDVGRRLALNALAKDYGQDVEFSGPVYRSMKVDGNKIRLSFDHASGLKSADGPLKHFSIAGEDQKFVWADATIEGNEVVVSSPNVARPANVRYAWANNPEGCNLVNEAGLPASPFRTDEWKGLTER